MSGFISADEGVDEAHARPLERGGLAREQGEVVGERGRSDQAVAGIAKAGETSFGWYAKR